MTLLTLAACSVFVAAGVWQLDRVDQKRERFRVVQDGLNAPATALDLPIDSAARLAWRKVIVRGRFDHAAMVLIDNRVLDGKPGYHVITPLKVDGPGRHVLVNRGWVSVGSDRTILPKIAVPSGWVSIEGLVTEPPARTFELGNVDPTGAVWPNLVLDRFSANRKMAIEPFVLLQTSPSDDGLIRRWSLPASGADKNQSYAMQWFSFALVAIAFYAFFSIKRTHD